MATIKKKAQNGGRVKTADSTAFYTAKRDTLAKREENLLKQFKTPGGDTDITTVGYAKTKLDRKKADDDRYRQKLKGTYGFDANGFPAKEFKKGGKITKKPCLGCGGKVKSKKK